MDQHMHGQLAFALTIPIEPATSRSSRPRGCRGEKSKFARGS
jgi:hypothetical protein